MNLLLLSNSTAPGRGYLDHALEAIDTCLGATRELVFVPFALLDHEGYTETVRTALARVGIGVRGAHEGRPDDAIRSAPAVFVGGGNTFRLTKALHDLELIGPLQELAHSGRPYLGSSAGTNIAAPTLMTTNDMPIVEPSSFRTLGLVPFQINTHYLDPDPESTHQGETREERIVQFLEDNAVPVLGLREGTWLRMAREGSCHLGGLGVGARLFRRQCPPREYAPGADLSFLL